MPGLSSPAKAKLISLALVVLVLLLVGLKSLRNDPDAGGKEREHADLRETPARPSRADDKKSNPGAPKPLQAAAERAPLDANSLKDAFRKTFAADSPKTETMDACRILIGKLSALEDCHDVLAFLDEVVGDGSDKTLLISSVFARSRNGIDDLIGEAGSLQNFDRQLAQAGLYDKIMHGKDSQQELAKLFNSGIPGLTEGGMATAFSVDLLSAGNPVAMKAKLAELAGVSELLAGSEKSAYLLVLAKSASQVLPFEVWQTVSPALASSKSGDSYSQEAMTALVSGMFGENPRRAADTIVASGDPAALQLGMQYWLNGSPKEATAWLEANLPSLTPGQSDSVSVAAAEHFLAGGNLEQARRQAAQIRDFQLRQKMEEEIVEPSPPSK